MRKKTNSRNAVAASARTKDKSRTRTFLLTWNPDKWTDEPPHGTTDSWACRTTAPKKDDRVFISRVGREPRGICASGRVVSFRSGGFTRLDEHWDPERRGKKARYVNVKWDSLPKNPIGDPLLSRSELKEGVLGGWKKWGPQSSGVEISDKKIADELERRWAEARRASQSSSRDSATPPRQHPPVVAAVEFSAHEGALKEQRRLTRGRNRKLRDQALLLAKDRCAACGRDYAKVLNGDGKRVLEVHHRRQLSNHSSPKLKQVTDLAVVCANCHRLLHVKPGKTLEVEELKRRLKKH